MLRLYKVAFIAAVLSMQPGSAAVIYQLEPAPLDDVMEVNYADLHAAWDFFHDSSENGVAASSVELSAASTGLLADEKIVTAIPEPFPVGMTLVGVAVLLARLRLGSVRLVPPGLQSGGS